MSGQDKSPRRLPALTRRTFIAGASLLTAGGIAAGVAPSDCGRKRSRATDSRGSRCPRRIRTCRTGSSPGARRCAPISTATRSRRRYDRLLMFDVIGRPTPQYARVLEATLRELEHAFPWGPDGLLFTVGWGPAYFKLIWGRGPRSRRPKRSRDFELPAIDHYHLCLHLACDDESRLREIEAALVHGAPLAGDQGSLSARQASCAGARRARASPAQACPPHTRTWAGSPRATRCSNLTPLFMGFKSGLKEPGDRGRRGDPHGAIRRRHDDARQLHAPAARQLVRELGQRGRVARMYAPQVTPAEAARFTTDAASDPQLLNQAIHRYGVVGHAQTSARARRNGSPIILRGTSTPSTAARPACTSCPCSARSTTSSRRAPR